ncbi:MAG: hypothetical protein A3F68_03495 [Acidobacteria bacterium RIFCSPLOWO2_12_FULL_54_10]|nr:MAG: hypothetical protein A3F68_03495 [Acidobacteria bacterium RIFCSPLOWO2_12_FULL_54_10]
MPTLTREKKPQVPHRSARSRQRVSSSSLHGNAVAVSVDERLVDLIKRYPALSATLQTLLIAGKKKIRDIPAHEQEKLLRTVFALKKAMGR